MPYWKMRKPDLKNVKWRFLSKGDKKVTKVPIIPLQRERERERERDALKTHLSGPVVVKITKDGIARYVCHRIVDSPHLAIHTSFCLTNHRK